MIKELRMLGDQFAAVLGAIVDTIDKHGLNRRHLSKHKAAAEKFVGLVSKSNFISEPASKLQARIAKYKTMLFTFLDFDGVSWNNNNAERAMKTFARHRRFADGKFTSRSIEHHLAILTVHQTCEFRGLDFLDFVLGRKNAGVASSVPWLLNERLRRRRPDSEPLPGFDAAATGGSARKIGRDGLEDAGSSPTPD